MSGNPFDGPQPTNAGDQLFYEGKRIDGSGRSAGGGGDHVVLFDPATQTASPNGIAMLKWMLSQVRAENKKQAKAMARVIAETVAPYEKRIAQLEAQLAAAQAEVTAAIGKELHDFVDGDEGPTLEELDAMAETHRKQIGGVRHG